jgi:hypothetical protein
VGMGKIEARKALIIKYESKKKIPRLPRVIVKMQIQIMKSPARIIAIHLAHRGMRFGRMKVESSVNLRDFSIDRDILCMR